METFTRPDGLVCALQSRGKQDEPRFIRSFDAHSVLIKPGEKYNVVYGKLNATVIVNSNKVTFIIDRQCDLINHVDLVIPDPDKRSLSLILEDMKVEYGEDYHDQMDIMMVRADMQTHVETSAALLGRKITHANGKTFVPLAMAPFHKNNLAFPSTIDQDLMIKVTFKQGHGVDLGALELYANKYVVSESARERLFYEPHSFMITQHLYAGPDPLNPGVNRIKLWHLRHPTYLIYFWGFDPTKVKNVRVLLDNDTVFYDGSIEALDHMKASRGLSHVGPTVVFLSDSLPGEPIKGYVNMSCIENARLEIDTEQEEATQIHVVGLACQPYQYVNGTAGTVFVT